MVFFARILFLLPYSPTLYAPIRQANINYLYLPLLLESSLGSYDSGHEKVTDPWHVTSLQHRAAWSTSTLWLSDLWWISCIHNCSIANIKTSLFRSLWITDNEVNEWSLFGIYSCFERGCLTNGEKLTRQCRKLLWVMVVFTVAWVNLKAVFQRDGRKQHKAVFVLSRSLLLNHLEPQSVLSKARLLLHTMPIGIVAYAFTLSWDNLCRNSCICY